MATSPIVAPVAQVSGPVALGKHSGTQLREGTNTPAGNPFMPRNNAVDGGRNSFETLERNVCSKDERAKETGGMRMTKKPGMLCSRIARLKMTEIGTENGVDATSVEAERPEKILFAGSWVIMHHDMYMSTPLLPKYCAACGDANDCRSRGRGVGRGSLMIRCPRSRRSIRCIHDLRQKQNKFQRLTSGELWAGPNASSTFLRGHNTYILM